MTTNPPKKMSQHIVDAEMLPMQLTNVQNGAGPTNNATVHAERTDGRRKRAMKRIKKKKQPSANA